MCTDSLASVISDYAALQHSRDEAIDVETLKPKQG